MDVDFPGLSANNRRGELSANQEKALAALITTPSITAAASGVGVTERTIRRWLREDDTFIARYRELRVQVTEEAAAKVQDAMCKAVDTLVDAMDAESAGARIRAAAIILETGFKARDENILERLEELERSAAWHDTGGIDW